MFFRKRLLLTVSSGVMAAMTAVSAGAADNKDANPIEEIVVTGTANAHGERKQDAAFAITTLNEEAIRNAIPSSAADLAKTVPGMFAEVTGGVSGPNIEVRGFPTAGDAPWVSFQLDGLPIFPVSTLSFLDNSTLLRLDDSVARMEATVGGPAVLWGTGEPGATVNLTQKNGLDNQEGLLRFTGGSGSLYRLDGYYGGKVADGWYASLGGFYRTDKGVRDTQYPADRGYQIEGTVVKTIDDGKLKFYARKTDDNNQFFTPIPLISTGSGTNTKVSGYPGFDPLTSTFFGNANRYVTLNVAPGQSLLMDESRGRGIDTQIFGLDFDKSWKGFDFSNKMSYMSGTTFSLTQFTGALPETLGDFINDAINGGGNSGEIGGGANGNIPLSATGGVAATGGTGTLISNGKAVGLNQEVIGVGAWWVEKKVTAFQDEGRISRQITDDNRLTLGFYFANYTTLDVEYTGNQQLLTLENHAQPISVVLNNGVHVTNNSGVYSPVNFTDYNDYTGRNEAVILADEWKITDRLKANAGFRLEHESIDASFENVFVGQATTNPLDLFSYGADILNNGSFTPYQNDWWAHSFGVGLDYELQKNLNVFVAYNQGYLMPTFDDLLNFSYNPSNPTYQFPDSLAITHVKQVQGGIKTSTPLYTLYLTGFYTDFSGQPANELLQNGTVLNYRLSSQSEGVEVEGAIRPFTNFELAVTGNYQHGTYSAGGPDIVGRTVARQPDLQFRVTPSYRIPTPWGEGRVYSTVTYVDSRWGDIQNTQFLPSYTTLDVGASMYFDSGVDLTFSGTNVTNTLGITEGNPRVLGAGVAGGVFLGRPLFGATYEASIALHF